MRSEIRRRIELSGSAEWNKLAQLNLPDVDPARAVRLLGAGFVFTKFLIAPVAKLESECIPVCSLGALLNLIVVVCDRLLDAGESVGCVLPHDELAAGGGEGSPVMALLREYLLRLNDSSRKDPLLRTIRKSIACMFQAEIQTVYLGSSLPYRFWLRKCSLPFVLMAIPAWAEAPSHSRPRYRRQLSWLYRVGRFFGALDDAIDIVEDFQMARPNYWSGKETPLSFNANRIAEWCQTVLEEWDRLLPGSDGREELREVFLHFVWGSLGM